MTRRPFGKLSIAVLILVGWSCGMSKHAKTGNAAPGVWAAQPVDIDGDSKEWPSPYPNYDAKGRMAYATSNDNDYLYVTMETGDELTQIKVLKNGLTMSIDTGGGKSPQFIINYPMPNDNSTFDMTKADMKVKNNEYGGVPSKQQFQKLKKGVDAATQYALEGFGSCSGGYNVNQTAPCGVKVRLGLDAYGELVWEAAIPLKALYGTTETKPGARTPVSVCFATKGMKKPDAKTDESSSTNMASNGMSGSGMNNPGMRGGNARRNTGVKSAAEDPMAHLYESTKTWKFFRLADKP